MRAAAEMGPAVVPGASGEGLEPSTARRVGFDFGIEQDGHVVGLVQTYEPDDRTLATGTFEVGIVLFKISDRGHGFGTEALRLFIDWLRREQGATRIQAVTAMDNRAMRRSLAKLGFDAEGEVRVGDLIETIFVLET